MIFLLVILPLVWINLVALSYYVPWVFKNLGKGMVNLPVNMAKDFYHDHKLAQGVSAAGSLYSSMSSSVSSAGSFFYKTLAPSVSSSIKSSARSLWTAAMVPIATSLGLSGGQPTTAATIKYRLDQVDKVMPSWGSAASSSSLSSRLGVLLYDGGIKAALDPDHDEDTIQVVIIPGVEFSLKSNGAPSANDARRISQASRETMRKMQAGVAAERRQFRALRKQLRDEPAGEGLGLLQEEADKKILKKLLGRHPEQPPVVLWSGEDAMAKAGEYSRQQRHYFNTAAEKKDLKVLSPEELAEARARLAKVAMLQSSYQMACSIALDDAEVVRRLNAALGKQEAWRHEQADVVAVRKRCSWWRPGWTSLPGRLGRSPSRGSRLPKVLSDHLVRFLLFPRRVFVSHNEAGSHPSMDRERHDGYGRYIQQYLLVEGHRLTEAINDLDSYHDFSCLCTRIYYSLFLVLADMHALLCMATRKKANHGRGAFASNASLASTSGCLDAGHRNRCSGTVLFRGRDSRKPLMPVPDC